MEVLDIISFSLYENDKVFQLIRSNTLVLKDYSKTESFLK